MTEIEYHYHDAAGPLVEVQVSAQGGKMQPCKALIDSGLRISGVPRRVLEAVQAAPVSSVPVVTILGNRQELQRYAVTVALGGISKSLQVFALDRDVALLGMDFLSSCVVVLDGKARTVRVSG